MTDVITAYQSSLGFRLLELLKEIRIANVQLAV